jgi:quercetin dioxygenase-like cupin family protein
MKSTILAAGAALLALAAPPAWAHEPAGTTETSTRIFERALPNAPGRMLIALEVAYPPGVATPSHRHPSSAFIYAYVLSGAVVSAVDDEEPRVYRAGESWYEAPGARHRVSRNASDTEPARLLAIFIADSGARDLVFPESP